MGEEKIKKQVPRELQNEFYKVCEKKIDDFIDNHTICRFSLMNLAMQMMAHGYYHEQEKLQKQSHE